MNALLSVKKSGDCCLVKSQKKYLKQRGAKVLCEPLLRFTGAGRTYICVYECIICVYAYVLKYIM